MVAGAIVCVAAWGVIWIQVESVLFTGPLLLAIGAALAVFAGLARDVPAVILGAAHCAVCVLFFGLVNMLHWSPDDARVPFLVMGAVYSGVAGVASAMMLVRRWPRAV